MRPLTAHPVKVLDLIPVSKAAVCNVGHDVIWPFCSDYEEFLSVNMYADDKGKGRQEWKCLCA